MTGTDNFVDHLGKLTPDAYNHINEIAFNQVQVRQLISEVGRLYSDQKRAIGNDSSQAQAANERIQENLYLAETLSLAAEDKENEIAFRLQTADFDFNELLAQANEKVDNNAATKDLDGKRDTLPPKDEQVFDPVFLIHWENTHTGHSGMQSNAYFHDEKEARKEVQRLQQVTLRQDSSN